MFGIQQKLGSFDSLYRGYPIGYILLWDVKEKNDQIGLLVQI